jgi:amidase
MLSLNDYCQFDGVALADAIRAGELSHDEVLAAAQRAIDLVNPKLNAVIGTIEPPATAATSDPTAAFAGVPYLLKDLAHGWAGVRDDKGSRLTKGYVETTDSVFGARSRGAGLVAIGRTNTPEFGMNATTEPVLYGATANPWDITRSPGGSSGGSAAAVAAGVVPFAYANDGGGSIRLPAAWCGLVGLKPSRGTNPRHDATDWILAEHIVSRTVRDTAAMLDVTAGPGLGAYVHRLPSLGFADAVGREPGRLRIGLTRRLKDGPTTDASCLASVEKTATICESLGHEIIESVPDLAYPEICQLCSDLYTPCIVPYIDMLARQTGATPGPDTLEAPAWTTYQHGMNTKATELIAHLALLTQMTEIMDTFMSDIDVWLTPAVSTTACLTGEYDPRNYRVGDLSFWHQEMALYSFLPLPSVTGQPALVLPIQGSDHALPCGVQLVGAQHSETLLLQLAGQLEQTAPWIHRRPQVHVSNN